MKALLVEDDLTISEMLAHVLTTHHWVVERATDGELGLELASLQDYDLILLDIGLPKLDGITVCQRLRSQGCQSSILLLTGQNSTEAQVAGLNAGADDYITKPFDIEVVLARVQSAARKSKAIASFLTWDTIQIDVSRGEVTCNNTAVHLTTKEYGVLELLLLNPQRVFTRRAILDHLWDLADAPGEETVSTHVKCVRQKLKAAGATDPIETVHGVGYRLRDPQALNPAPKLPAVAGHNQPLDATSQSKAQAVTAKVWNRFKTQYLEQIQTITAFVSALQPGAASPPQYESQRLAHKLVGSLGMFGLSEAAHLARQLEQLMQTTTLTAPQIATVQQMVEQLRQIITQAQVVTPPKAQPIALQPHISAQPPAFILIVDDDPIVGDHLRIEAIAWNLRAEVATDLSLARQQIRQQSPNLIVLDLSFPGEETGLILLRELAQQAPPIPVIVLTAKEALQERVAASQLGVKAFLHKPLPAYEVFKTVTDVLHRTTQVPQGDRLLLVDDDYSVLEVLSVTLSDHGVEVITTSKAATFWQVLTASDPTVLILDLAMPEFDGVELCRVVRADPKWQHLKILFLSAHTDAAVMAKAYAAGADDYISKLGNPTEIAERILNRLGHPQGSL